MNNRGFSLIELLIVVVIIGIVAAIALPNLVSSRRAANESSTVAGLRTLYGANMAYAASLGGGSFAGTAGTVGTSSLTELAGASLVDTVLGSGQKSGYDYVGNRIVAAPMTPETFYFAANPSISSGILMTGMKRYGVGNDGVIRLDTADLAVPFDETTLLAATPLGNL